MKQSFTQIAKLILLSMFAMPVFAQTTVCEGIFEEQDGLLVIEMESADRSFDSRWQLASEPDPNLEGSTINYIFWNGPQSFNDLSNAILRYNIRINTPGTYRFLVRGRIGMGDERDLHNDYWLNIEADDFFAERFVDGQLVSTLGATPECNANPDRGCSDSARDEDGFIKAFMNVTPTNGEGVPRVWRFVSNANNTRDGNDVTRGAHLLIRAVFNEPGNYAVNIDARSSYFFMDKMILFRDGVARSTAENLNNPESTCNEDPLSTEDVELNSNVTIYPNPARNSIEFNNTSNTTIEKLVLRNVLGATIREIEIKNSKQIIDVSDLKSGVYFLSSTEGVNFTKRFIKL